MFQPPLFVGCRRSYACTSTHTHHALFTLESPQEQLLRPLCQKALVVAKISSKQVKNLGTSELNASYRLTCDAASLPNVTTVSQHSFDLASERENKAPVPSLSREATVLCMYVICLLVVDGAVHEKSTHTHHALFTLESPPRATASTSVSESTCGS